MSGGHWGYMSRKLEEAAEAPPLARGALRLLAKIEHELDWGHSGDTCLACARRRVLYALDRWFDAVENGVEADVPFGPERAVEMCDACLARVPNWGRLKDANPSKAEAAAEIARRLTETARPYV